VTGSAVLGVDFGTSNTVAALRTPAGETRLILFDGSPLLLSAVFADDSGGLIVGRDAQQRAAARPAAYEPNPKRHVADGSLLLGGVEVPVVAAIAAVLRRVAAEAGADVDRVVLSCPVAWGAGRRAVLTEAAAAAGLPAVTLVPEPVAAAAYFLAGAQAGLAEGQTALVYDFGAGTFDASVVRRTGGQLRVLASHGLADAGGLDIDAAVVANLHAQLRPADPAWARLHHPQTPADLRARQQLWDNVRAAKEALSRNGATFVHVPLLDTEVPLGREQFEALAMPILDRTVGAARAALRDAGVEADALYRVGGSSRVPLVATLLHRRFGLPPAPIDQPELAVALGCLTAPHEPAMPLDLPMAPAPVPPSVPATEADTTAEPAPDWAALPMPDWAAGPAPDWAMEPAPAPAPAPDWAAEPAPAPSPDWPALPTPDWAAAPPPTMPGEASDAVPPGTAANRIAARLRRLPRAVPVAAGGAVLAVTVLVTVLVANGAAGARDDGAAGRSPSPTVQPSATPSSAPPTLRSPTPAVPTGDLSLKLAKTTDPCHVGTWDATARGHLVIFIAYRGVITGQVTSSLSGYGVRFAAAGIQGGIRYLDKDGDIIGSATSFDNNPGVSYGEIEVPAPTANQILGLKVMVEIVVDPFGDLAETDEANNTLKVQLDLPAELTEHGYAEATPCRVVA
jgi:molecular chaperone DnaK